MASPRISFRFLISFDCWGACVCPQNNPSVPPYLLVHSQTQQHTGHGPSQRIEKAIHNISRTTMAESLLFTVPPPAPLSPPTSKAVRRPIRRRKRSLAASAASVVILGESLHGIGRN